MKSWIEPIAMATVSALLFCIGFYLGEKRGNDLAEVACQKQVDYAISYTIKAVKQKIQELKK